MGASADGLPDGADQVVELRIPADLAFVPMLRTLGVSLAARCDLTVDQIEDLGIAVDESCALLLPAADKPEHVSARFTLAYGRLDVEVQVVAHSHTEPDRDGFAWTVLSAVADVVHVGSENGALSIRLQKRREPG